MWMPELLHDWLFPGCAEHLIHGHKARPRQAALWCVDQASLTLYYTNNANILFTDITAVSLEYQYHNPLILCSGLENVHFWRINKIETRTQFDGMHGRRSVGGQDVSPLLFEAEGTPCILSPVLFEGRHFCTNAHAIHWIGAIFVRCSQWILKKIIKVVGTRCQILRLKCINSISAGWALPQTLMGELTVLPRPSSWI